MDLFQKVKMRIFFEEAKLLIRISVHLNNKLQVKLSNPVPLILIVFSGIFISSCVKKPEYPSEPVIAYKDFIRYGNPSSPDSVEIEITFTDNEGDIGLTQADMHGFFSKGNVCLYETDWDTTGVDHWAVWDNPVTPQVDTTFVYYPVPLVLPEGDPNEPVKGLIFIKRTPFVAIFPRIMYTIYMYDLARHKSNTIETPPIDF
jgi:hypothetical protein